MWPRLLVLLERLKSMSIESRPAKAAALCEFTADDLKAMNDFVHYDLRSHANEKDPCRFHSLQWGLADHNGHACDHEHSAMISSSMNGPKLSFLIKYTFLWGKIEMQVGGQDPCWEDKRCLPMKRR